MPCMPMHACSHTCLSRQAACKAGEQSPDSAAWPAAALVESAPLRMPGPCSLLLHRAPPRGTLQCLGVRQNRPQLYIVAPARSCGRAAQAVVEHVGVGAPRDRLAHLHNRRVVALVPCSAAPDVRYVVPALRAHQRPGARPHGAPPRRRCQAVARAASCARRATSGLRRKHGHGCAVTTATPVTLPTRLRAGHVQHNTIS